MFQSAGKPDHWTLDKTYQRVQNKIFFYYWHPQPNQIYRPYKVPSRHFESSKLEIYQSRYN